MSSRCIVVERGSLAGVGIVGRDAGGSGVVNEEVESVERHIALFWGNDISLWISLRGKLKLNNDCV